MEKKDSKKVRNTVGEKQETIKNDPPLVSTTSNNFNAWRLFFGLTIITIGAALLGQNFGLIDLQQISLDVLKLWPIIIILIGISMFSYKSWLGKAFAVVFTLFLFASVLFLSFTPMQTDLFDSRKTGKITEERNVSTFDKISVSTIGNITLKQGDKEGLKIKGDREVLRQLRTEVQDGRLIVRNDESSNWPQLMYLRGSDSLEIEITVRNIREITVSGAGRLDVQKLKTDNLTVIASGAEKANLNVDVKNLKVEISGAGDFTLRGSSEEQNVEISGAGKYNSKNLTSKKANVNLSGLSSAVVKAEDELKVDISGGGKVEYLGEPKITQNISGVGKVERYND